jgi:DNA-binding transcriptional LysR family regulator
MPSVFIDIDIASPSQIDQAVIDGKVDIGITSSVRRTHNLRFHDLKEETTALYCGKGHPLFSVPERSLSVEKLLKHSFVRAYGSYYPKKILRTLQGVGSSCCIPLDARALLVATGHFLGLMPEEFARPYVQRGLLRELMPEAFRYSYALSIVTQANSENAALGKFLDILEEELTTSKPSKTRQKPYRQSRRIGVLRDK